MSTVGPIWSDRRVVAEVFGDRFWADVVAVTRFDAAA